MQRQRGILRRGSSTTGISTNSVKSRSGNPHAKLGKFFSMRKRSSSVTDGMIRDSVREASFGTEAGDDDAGNSNIFHVMAAMPDGSKHVLSGEHGMRVADLVSNLAMDYRLHSYKVYMASNRALLNPEAEAQLLDGQDISIEDSDLTTEDIDPRIASDGRLKLLYELLKSEKVYQESLRSIFELYAEPLRKFSSLGKEDHKVLFFGLEPLLSLSKTLCLKLEDALENWDNTATRLGNQFSKQFWYQYDEYYFSYPVSRQLLRDKRQTDEEFVEFCRLRRGAARHSLESLLLLPVQRIPSYDKYLNELLDQTDETHPDYEDLSKAANKVRTMMKEREDELIHIENEHKVESVQERFPNDDLQLHDNQKQKTKSLRSRRSSAPGAVLFRTLSKKHSSGGNTQSLSLIPDAAKPGNANAASSRIYVLEGPVQLATGVQTQDRYLFLFNDLLLIAKQKNSTCFKLKHRVRVCEMWTASCVDDVSEVTRTTDKSFVIGWPIANTVATFSSPDMRDLWYGRLTEQIAAQKAKEEQKTVIKIVNKNTDMSSTTKSISVSNCEEARDIVSRCMEEFHDVSGDPKDYQLWVRSGKEDAPYPLIGHEHPYSIKMSHARDVSGRGSLSSMDEGFFPTLDMDGGDASSHVHFILRQTKKTPTKMGIDENRKSRKSKKSPFSNLFARRDKSKGSDSSNSGATGKLFGHCLSDICPDDGFPKPIMDLLHLLFIHGPYTTGIFRKSANAKKHRELRERLDNGEEFPVDEEVPIMVAASLLKDFVRNLADCIFLCDLYEQWLETVDIQDTGQRLTTVRYLMSRLPRCHQNLLAHMVCVLYHVDQRSEHNNMTAYNLAVCIGQSMLWPQHSPDGGVSIHADALAKVPMCVQFLIQHCDDVFEPSCSKLFGEVVPKSRQDSTDSDSMPSVLGLHTDHINMAQRDNSSLDSLDRDLYGSEVESSPGLAKSHLSPTNLSRDSGLTLSDTQLYDDDACSESTTGAAAAAAPHHKVVSRSVSHFEEGKPSEDPGMLSRSYDATLDCVGAACKRPAGSPVPPPRKPRATRAELKPPTEAPAQSQLLRYSSSSQNIGDLRRAARHAQFKKRISDDSLGSLDEYSEVSENSSAKEDFQDYKDKHEETVFLRKSESGARLFISDNTYNMDIISDDIVNSAQFVDPFAPPSSSESSPITPGSGMLQPTAGMHNIRRRLDQPPSPSPLGTVCETGQYTFTVQDQPKFNRLSRMAGSDFSASLGAAGSASQVAPMDFSASYGGSSLKPRFQLTSESLDSSFADSFDGASENSGDRLDTPDSTSDNAHPGFLPGKQGVQIVAISESSEAESKDNEDEDEEVAPPRPPPPSQLQLATPPSEPTWTLDTNSAKSSHAYFTVPGRHSPPPTVILRHAKAGMTPTGADVYPKRMAQKLHRRSLQEDQLLQTLRPFHESLEAKKSESPSPPQLPRKAIIKQPLLSGAHLQKAQRSESFGSKRNTGPIRLQHASALEKSASDTSVVEHFAARALSFKPERSTPRPAEPPSYQEAMKRKSMLQEQVPEASQEDKLAQSVNSARARKLYEESLRMYESQGQGPDPGTMSDSENWSRDDTRSRRSTTRKAPLRIQRSSSLSRMGLSREESSRETRETSPPQPLPGYEQACRRAERLKMLASRAKQQQKQQQQRLANARQSSPSPPRDRRAARTARPVHAQTPSPPRSSPARARVQRQKTIPMSVADYVLTDPPRDAGSPRSGSPILDTLHIRETTKEMYPEQRRDPILKSSRKRESTPPSSFRIQDTENERQLKPTKSRKSTPPSSFRIHEFNEQNLKSSRGRENTPPSSFRIELSPEKEQNLKASRNRESTPPSSFRIQGSPEKERTNNAGQGREGTPPSGGQNQRKREKTPTRRERRQRLSDTRLHSKSFDASMSASCAAGLSRSKSDSSEHINKVGRFKQMTLADKDSENKENNGRSQRITRPKSEYILPDLDRLSRSHTPERVLEEKLDERNLQALLGEYNLERRARRHSVNSVKHRDWHKELADQFKEEELCKALPQKVPKYTYATAAEVIEDTGNKRRWSRPVHPSKDLIMDCSKDYSLRSASNNGRNSAKSSGNGGRTGGSAAVSSQPGQQVERVVPEVVNRRPMDTDSASSTEDDSAAESAGINWSVSKLRHKYDQSKKGQLSTAEQTNPNAEEAYV